MALFFLCLCLCCLPLTTSVRVVSSNWKMTRLADFEQILVNFARERSTALPQQFVNFVSSIHAEHASHVHLFTFVNFPINLYRLIRRFTYEWPRWMVVLRNLSSKSSSTAIKEFLNHYEKFSQYFDSYDKIRDGSDFLIATNSLSVLHLLYGKATGLLDSDHPTNCQPLTELELLELSADSFLNPHSNEPSFHSFHWLQLFIDRVAKFYPYWSIKKIIGFVIASRDFYGVPNSRNSYQFLGYRMQKLNGVLHWFLNLYPKLLRHQRESFEQLDTTRTCRAAKSLRKRDFYCFRFYSPHAPYAPFKYEILSTTPYVAFVHDFMTRRKTFTFIQRSIDSGSTINHVVISNKGGDLQHGVLAKVRLSESTFITPNSDLNRWLDFRVEHATLLQPNSQPMSKNITDGEVNHILQYGLSGYYISHWDYLGNDTHTYMDPGGDRLATVLVYLTDVESGGYTVFPRLGLHVAPQAGAALVWFNQHPENGKYLKKTMHAACPVNVGKKWVINRWILNHERTGFSRPVWK